MRSISLGAFPTAMRASSASVSGVATEGGHGLIECQLAPAYGPVELGQLAQRKRRAGDASGGAVVAAVGLREPLRDRREPGPLPILAIRRAPNELADLVRVPRGALRELAEPVPARVAHRSRRAIDRLIHCDEHTFVYYHADTLEFVTKLCHYCGDI